MHVRIDKETKSGSRVLNSTIYYLTKRTEHQGERKSGEENGREINRLDMDMDMLVTSDCVMHVVKCLCVRMRLANVCSRHLWKCTERENEREGKVASWPCGWVGG